MKVVLDHMSLLLALGPELDYASHRQSVSHGLSDLNKPLPHDLFVEVRRLEILEKNTLVRHGFSDSALLPVPDPESEVEVAKQTITVNVVDEDSDPASPLAKKRKMDDRDDSENNLSLALSPNKKG
jgi:hypothetical protein